MSKNIERKKTLGFLNLFAAKSKEPMRTLPVIDELEAYLMNAIDKGTPTSHIADWMYKHSMTYRDYYIDLDILQSLHQSIVSLWIDGRPQISSDFKVPVRAALSNLRWALGYAQEFPRELNTESSMDAFGKAHRERILLFPEKAIAWRELPGDFAFGWMNISESTTDFAYPSDLLGQSLSSCLQVNGKYALFPYSSMTMEMQLEEYELLLQYSWIQQRILEKLARETGIEAELAGTGFRIPQEDTSTFLDRVFFEQPKAFTQWLLRIRNYAEGYNHYAVKSGAYNFFGNIIFFLTSQLVKNIDHHELTVGGFHVPVDRHMMALVSNFAMSNGQCTVDLGEFVSEFLASFEESQVALLPRAIEALVQQDGDWLVAHKVAYRQPSPTYTSR